MDSVKDGGELISGYFYPPESGDYVFSLAADDGRPTDSDPDVATPALHVPGYRKRPLRVSRDLWCVARWRWHFLAMQHTGGELYLGKSWGSKKKIAAVHAFLGTPGNELGDSTKDSTRSYFEEVRSNEKKAVSEPISLMAGQPYYIEALEVNRQGRDVST